MFWQADFADQKHMLINTEWGAFGDNGELDFIRTKWDKNVDEMSVNPGKQVGFSSIQHAQTVLSICFRFSRK